MADDLNSWAGVAAIRAECEEQAMNEGLAGLELFFRSQSLFTDRLAAASRRQGSAPRDDLIRALEAIRDGHNDPRALAADTLAAYESRLPNGRQS